MINIKISWSLIAPKKSEIFDEEYLENLSIFLTKNFENFVLHHWTWNVGHGFVEKYGLEEKTIDIGKKALKDYFEKIDEIFWIERIWAENFLAKKIQNWRYIVWWDISSERKIISSDVTFARWVGNSNQDIHFILADIEWVKDKDWNTIKILHSNLGFEDINFWKKDWDVSWGMEWKLKSLIWIKNKTIWLIDWKNFENFEKILKTWDWDWTKIIL